MDHILILLTGDMAIQFHILAGVEPLTERDWLLIVRELSTVRLYLSTVAPSYIGMLIERKLQMFALYKRICTLG